MILENMQKLFLTFTFFILNLEAQAAPSSQACHKAFAAFGIQKVFSNFKSYTKYKGQEGYLLFVEQSPTNSMDYAFSRVSKALGENFRK